nr:hypothetical protein [Clostridiaceae bacterium]
ENTYLITAKPQLAEEISEHLQARKHKMITVQGERLQVISLALASQECEKLGICFSRDDLQQLYAGGLTIIPRIRSWNRTNEEDLVSLVQALGKIQGISMITFNEEAVPGDIKSLAYKLEGLNVPVGMFEFYPQQGLTNLAQLLGKNAVRIHCINEGELKKYNEQSAVERFNLAVSERNMRALYLRFFGMEQPENALDRGLKFVTQVKNNLLQAGFQIGAVQDLPGIPYSRWLILAVGLGVLGGGLLFLNRFVSPGWTALLGLVGLIGWAGLLFVQPLLARKLFALAAVIIFPVVAVTALVEEKKRTLIEAVTAFLKMVGISGIGALLMTGLLADKAFMLKLDQFSGVKVAHVVPLLIIPLYFFLKDSGKQLLTKLKKVLAAPLLVWYALAALALLVILVIYLLRTGNEAGILVSSWENKMRELLDTLLLVRPRTKEFLVGHPFMLILLYFGYTHRKMPLLILGVIGQISLVNTYAHLHTPLMISLLRSVHGLWLGILFGVLLILMIKATATWLAGRLADG